MLDIKVHETEPFIDVETFCTRAYIHGLIAEPDEPVAEFLEALSLTDEENQRVMTANNEVARVNLLRTDPRFIAPLTVADNLSLTLQARGLSVEEANDKTFHILDLFNAHHIAQEHPEDVPLFVLRLLAAERDLETDAQLVAVQDLFAGVDSDDYGQIAGWISGLYDRIEGILLVHASNPSFMMGIADRLMMIHEGKLVHHDTLHGIVRQPVSTWASDNLRNVYRGKVDNSVLRMTDGRKIYGHSNVSYEDAIATVHPRAVSVYREKPGASTRNIWHGKVAGLEPAGTRVRVNFLGLTPIVAEVSVNTCKRLNLAIGGPVWVSFKASSVDIFPFF